MEIDFTKFETHNHMDFWRITERTSPSFKCFMFFVFFNVYVFIVYYFVVLFLFRTSQSLSYNELCLKSLTADCRTTSEENLLQGKAILQ